MAVSLIRSLTGLTLLLLVLFAGATGAQSTTVPDGDTDALAAAIAQANSADAPLVITLASRGTYLLNSELPTLTGNLVIEGQRTTIERDKDADPFRIFTVEGGELTLRHVIVRNGSAANGGGVHVTDGTLRLQNDTEVRLNTGINNGGGVYAENSLLEVSDTQINANHVQGTGGVFGGGFYARDSQVYLLNGAFIGNNTGDETQLTTGVGGYVEESTVVVADVRFSNNSTTGAGLGGGLALQASNAAIFKALFASNALESGDGGGLYVATNENNTIDLFAAEFLSNSGTNGGGLYTSGSGRVSLVATLAQGNMATRGGGWYVIGGGRITGSLVQGNRANTGAGFYVQGGDVQVLNSTVRANAASVAGGAGYAESPGMLSVGSTTLVGNTGTMSNNTFETVGAAVRLQNTIISENQNGTACTFQGLSLGHNILTSACRIAITGTDQVVTDNVIGMFDLNGGKFGSFAIPANSPATDGGDPTGCTDFDGIPIMHDQRGFERVDGACDIGAFERSNTGNRVPDAEGDSFSVANNEILETGAVLRNDSDGNGQQLFPVLKSLPERGTLLSYGIDGRFVYVPDPSDPDPDDADGDGNVERTFVYQLCDAYDLCASGDVLVNITVTPANQIPLAQDDRYTVLEGAALEVAESEGLLVNDSDPDGDDLRVSPLIMSAAEGVLINIGIDGSLSYFNRRPGEDVYEYEVCDNRGACATASVMFTIEDVPSSLEVTKATNSTEVEDGGNVSFTVTVDNSSPVDTVTLEALNDDLYGNLSGQGDCAVPQVLAPGESYRCVFTGTVTDPHENTVTASGTDDDGVAVTASDSAIVTVLPGGCDIGELTLTGLSGTQVSGVVTIGAEFSGPRQPSSVQFELAGLFSETNLDDAAPFFLLGDEDGEPIGWNTNLFPDGSYTLTITPFNGDEACFSETVDLFVLNEQNAQATLTCPAGTTPINLVEDYQTLRRTTPTTAEFPLEIDRDSPGGTLRVLSRVGHPERGCPESGDRFCGQDQMGETFAIFVDGDRVGRVPDHGNHQIETFSFGVPLDAGDHTVEFRHVRPDYSTRIDSVDFIAVYCTSESIAVNGFTLVNAASEQDIRPLADGDTLDLSELPNLSIRADTVPETVGSVTLEMNGDEILRNENLFPYALGGDRNGDYNRLRLEPGTYTVTATPYGRRNAEGEAGTPLTITFTVVE